MTSRLAKVSNGILETQADVARGVRALERACPIMRRIHATAGTPAIRRRAGGFEGIARIIVGQQVSTASANAIWGRFTAHVAPLTATTLAAESDEALRACGLSRPKIRTLRALSAAVTEGSLDVAALEQARDEEVHAKLTTVSGIGPWTADVYIMFCLGRADSFAAGDLALQIAAQHAADLDARPNPSELSDLAERWRPWRAVAACMLWAYYPHIKTARPAAGDSGQPV